VKPQSPLTEREFDVVRLVALGRTNAEIAESMYVSLSTVKTHLGSIQHKLAAETGWKSPPGLGKPVRRTAPPAASFGKIARVATGLLLSRAQSGHSRRSRVPS
jgi:hypothetical protein